MTPRGSFHGSKRPTWVITGRSKSTSNRGKIVSNSSRYTWRFFGLVGSIAGGFTEIRGNRTVGGGGSRGRGTGRSVACRGGGGGPAEGLLRGVRARWRRQSPIPLP